MSKPDDIPQDIWDVVDALSLCGHGYPDDGDYETIARAILAERERLTDPVNLARHLDNIGVVGKEAVQEAVLAEREQCASKLEAMVDTYLPGGPMDAKGGLKMAAAAIRARS